MAKPSETSPPPAVIVAAALPQELRAVRKTVERMVNGFDVDFIATGVGRDAATRAVSEALRRHSRVAGVVSCGFAGAITDVLSVGDGVRPSEVIDPEGRRQTIENDLPATDASRHRLVTVDAPVTDIAARKQLAARTGADCVDMESSAVANVCHGHGVRFVAVRAISDDLRHGLPAEVGRLAAAGGDGPYSLTREVLSGIVRRPGLIADLWRLSRDAKRAAATLGPLVADAVRELNDPPE
ncbi:MAG: hypothetical protein AAF532_10200 [Planctomycetota bacterium]